jgi:iron complex outermembrane receptor protein
MKRQYCVKKQLYCNNYKQTKPNSTYYEKIALLLILLNLRFFLHKRCLGVVKDNNGNPLPGVNIIEKELKTEFLLILMDRTRLK